MTIIISRTSLRYSLYAEKCPEALDIHFREKSLQYKGNPGNHFAPKLRTKYPSFLTN